MHRYVFLSPLYNLQVVLNALLIVGKILSKRKEQKSHKRTQVSQLAATQRSEESSDQGILNAQHHSMVPSPLPYLLR